MTETRDGTVGCHGEAGFTLVEALVAIVVLIFGLMAVTNLMLVAASSNSVANQGTAAVASAIRAMDMLKATDFGTLDANRGGTAFTVADAAAAKSCSAADLGVADWHCNDDVPGVGFIHTHWYVEGAGDVRLLYVRVRSEGTGALSAARSRAEFTIDGGCPNPSNPTPGPSPSPAP
jgi:Tfp pilus assembly protein PilV